jgi:RNA polymerase sigma factor (sigma-70 family)
MRNDHTHNIDLSEYLPLVRRIAIGVAHHTSTFVPVDDLSGEGYLGLLKAARRYQPTGDASFTTYAYPTVRGHMLNLVNRENRHASCHHAVAQFTTRGPERVLLVRERQRQLLAAIDELSPPRRQVVTLLLAGRSTAETAGIVRISPQRVRRNKVNAIGQLNEKLCHAG